MIVEKHIKLTGTSDVSWKDAITKTVLEASKTIDLISSIEIIKQYADVTGNKISKYYVVLDLKFNVDLERK